CNLDLRLVDVSLKDKYFILFGVPFPNPASAETKLEFIEFLPKMYNRNLKIQLYDIMGNLVQTLTANKLDIENEKYGDLIRWSINIDTSVLISGRYLIKINNPKGENVFSFIKI